MSIHEDAVTQVKLIRLGDFKRDGVEFVGRVVETNALLSFRLRRGYMLGGRPGDTVGLTAFKSAPHPRSNEPSFVPMECSPVDAAPSASVSEQACPAVGQKRERLF